MCFNVSSCVLINSDSWSTGIIIENVQLTGTMFP
jgi:hypothetical protein